MYGMPRALTPVLAVAAVAFASGCGGAATSSAPRIPVTPSLISGVGTVQHIADAAPLVLPIQAYLLTEDQINQQQMAEYVLESKCLTRYGFNWTPPTLPPSGDGGYNARRYGVPGTLQMAQTYGFHFETPPPTPDRRAALSDAEKNVMMGYVASVGGKSVPTGGCVAVADQELSGGNSGLISGTSSEASQIKAASFVISQADPRVVAAQASWSKCMKTHGYNFKNSLDEAIGNFIAPGPSPSSQEIGIAVASWTCGQKVNLVGTWFGVESAYQKAQIEKNAQELSQEKAALDTQMANVQKALG